MSIKGIMATHPKLVTLAIGLGITMAIGTAIGILEHGQLVYAAAAAGGGGGGGGGGAGHGGGAAGIHGVGGNGGTSNACTNDGAAEHNPHCIGATNVAATGSKGGSGGPGDNKG